MVNSKSRQKMPISERAKQFAPFSALKGLPEALKKMEKIVVPKRELTEERLTELNRALNQIKRGMMVTAIYFSEGEYLQITGLVARHDIQNQKLQIVDTVIPFADLYEIKIES